MASEDDIKLPPELITEILHCLPAKSLGRFRCVSKDWLSLISQPQFIKTHQITHNQNHLIFISTDHSLYSLAIKAPFHHHEAEEARTPTKLHFKSKYIYFTIHGSCNGLVLVSAHNSDPIHTLVVVNPTTTESIELPKSDYKVINDLFETEIAYGLGYDSLTDDYKVITISYFHNNYLIPPDRMYVHVYSLRSNTWKRVIDSPYDHSYRKSFPGVFVNGFLHWVAKKASSDQLPLIVAFSLANEMFSEVPLPDLCNDVDNCKLIVLGVKLGVFVNGVIWVMNDYGVRESWIEILIDGVHEISIAEPVFCEENGKIVLVGSDLLLIYDVEEGSLCKNVEISWNKRLKVKGVYVESLVSPKVIRFIDGA